MKKSFKSKGIPLFVNSDEINDFRTRIKQYKRNINSVSTPARKEGFTYQMEDL